ncbi:MAG TPA: hypothetical protein VIM29_04830 [Bacillota bacterium]
MADLTIGIQLVFYGLVIILFFMLLNKLERISTLLAETVNHSKHTNTGAIPAMSVTSAGRGSAATEDEIAAVLAVIAKLLPDKQVAAIRLVSK